MTAIDLECMPQLRDLFNKLRSGHHLCADDGAVYHALRAGPDEHRALFDAIGFDLVEDQRGFYYFRSSETFSREASQLTVFFFVLVQAWGDAGKDLEATVFNRNGHSVRDLPHLSRDSWRRYLEEAGISDHEDLAKLVKSMRGYGFLELVDGDRFRFRTPAWRLLDLCIEILDEERQKDMNAAKP